MIDKYLEKVIIPMLNKTMEENDVVMNALWNRMFEKLRCTVLVQAIADAALNSTDGLKLPVGTREHAEFAIKYHEAILATVHSHCATGSFANPVDGCVAALESRVTRWPGMAEDRYGKYLINEPKRFVSKSWLTKVFSNKCKPLMDLCDNTCKGDLNRARDMVIKESIDRGLITPDQYKGKQVYKLSRG